MTQRQSVRDVRPGLGLGDKRKGLQGTTSPPALVCVMVRVCLSVSPLIFLSGTGVYPLTHP